jgi:protein-S-isoprenylcysteine O-methyltransferase Ste14
MPEHAMLAVWIVWWTSWLAAAAWSDRAVRRPAGRRELRYRLLAAGGAGLLYGMYPHDSRAEIILWRMPLPLAWFSVAIALLGLLFAWWARVHLGRLWSASVTSTANHRVVDTGPYGIVRHPIYTGILAASIATAALRATPLAWLGVGMMTVGWVLKARMEEKFLREQLGADRYDAYARRVPMLSPFGRRSTVAER